MFPVVYILMSRKTTECYTEVFEFIEKEVFKLQPAELMTDFEKGLRKSITKVYPNTEVRGCWFHFCQALRKKSRALGLQTLQAQNASANIIIKEFMSLPLLPPEKIVEGFNQIIGSIREHGLTNEFKKFTAYFKNFWMKQVNVTLLRKFFCEFRNSFSC